jgi:hypothetical protein
VTSFLIYTSLPEDLLEIKEVQLENSKTFSIKEVLLGVGTSGKGRVNRRVK